MRPQQIFVFQGRGEGKNTNIVFVEKSLKNALLEKNAYKDFILNMDKEKFKEYLK